MITIIPISNLSQVNQQINDLNEDVVKFQKENQIITKESICFTRYFTNYE
ncbi:hypothetical protein BCR32DRAFT_282405 [Anaeromyces robustus]|uniref:Uncharacterized protein n=1 Tax=Anaeromyces robustus TaxID=1754192 RepID=A0A1Y1WYA3_9FUNG|nr:hypothetical protein BCR32DRAFT_282405 [Anaeromyces robustus]|eukprot:ORX78308.1 hypothetical protein BCR32DRAFT_282405 [Anaeromyces robustus]